MVHCVLAILATVALASVAFAGEHTYRRTEEQIKVLLERLQSNSERLRNSIADALEGRGALALPGIEPAPRASIYKYARNLTQATGQLVDSYSENQTDPASVEQALRSAVAIDGLLWRHHVTPQLQAHWQMLRGDLKELADAYHVPWGWLGPIGHAPRRSEMEMRGLIDQIETRSDDFRKRLDDALDERFYLTNAENNVNQLVEDFEHATDRLRDELSAAAAAPLAVHDVLSKSSTLTLS